MKNLGKVSLIFMCCALLTACMYHNPEYKQYLHKTFTLKQDMYVCEVQYRQSGQPDRYYMRDPHVFSVLCEDSMYNVAYRTKPAIWPQGHGDFWEREWLIAKLPRGTRFYLDDYLEPNPGRQSNTNGVAAFSEAIIIVASGKYTGLRAEWQWFDFEREIDRPIYPVMPNKYLTPDCTIHGIFSQ
jgi:hypothetical protein